MTIEPLEIPLSYKTPTRLNKMPYGSLLKVLYDEGAVELYIQVSRDSETSRWITVGELFVRSHCYDIESIGYALMTYTEMTPPEPDTLIYPRSD